MITDQQTMQREKLYNKDKNYYDKKDVSTVTQKMRVGLYNRVFTIYNDQVDYKLQWMIDQNIFSCSWMRVLGKEVSSKLTSCDIELRCIDIQQINKDGLAPWRILSYDIESLPPPRGNTGKYNFPTADKDPVVTIGAVLQIDKECKQFVWILRPFGDEVDTLPAFDEEQDCDYDPSTSTVYNFQKESELLVR